MNNSVYDLEKLFFAVFLIMFVAGLIIILISCNLDLGLGYDYGYGYFKPISFMVIGGVISLVSGYGLVNVIMKIINNQKS